MSTGVGIEVVGGGRPDGPTLTAIERALALVLARRGRDAGTAAPVTPAWRRAALREGVGGPRSIRPDRRA